jgi:hypothetical protein
VPELDDGADELLELLELELGLLVLELLGLEVAELLILLEPDPVDAEEDVVCVDPGRVSATAPAVTRLAKPTVAVVALSLFRPRALAAMACAILSRCDVLMPRSLPRNFRSIL